jgi:diguanylate cyclase (GGDEF)-like protein/PAS domain S-box-containing protein
VSEELARAGELAAGLVDVVYAIRLEPDMGFEYVSPSVEAMVGYTPQEHYDDPQLGMRLLDPRDLDVLLGAVKADVGEQVDMTVRWIAKDGQLLWTQHRCVKRLRDDESVVLYGAARDVTEQHVLAERYRLLAENGSDVVAVGTDAGVLEWVSPSVTGLLGWSPEEMAGRAFRDFVDPADLSTVVAVQEGLSRGEPGRFEARLRTSAGGVRWVSIALKPVFDDDGIVVGRIAGWRDAESEHEARAALATSEERFRLLAENASDVVIEVSGDGTIAWVSPSAAQVLGWNPIDLMGTQPWKLIHPGDEATAIASLAEIAAGDVESARIDLRVRKSDGTYMWMAASGHHAALDRVVVSFRDIDARVAAQHAAAEAREMFQLLAENASDGVAMSAPDGVIEWLSPSVEGLLGWPPDDLIGSSFMELVHPDDLPAAGAVRSTLANGTPSTFSARIRQSDGAYRWISPHVRPILDPDGVLIRRVVGLRDVQAEHEAREALAASEQRYRLLSDNATDVVYMVDPDRRVSWISPTVTTTLGWDPDELVGTSMYDLIHVEDQPKIDALREAVFRGEAIVNPRGGWPSRFRHKDGTYTWMALKTTTIDDESGQLAFAVTGMRDVDDLVKQRQLAEYESERRQAIVDTLLDPHVLLEAVRDESGEIVDFIYADANDAACKYNHVPRDELIGMRLLDLLPGHMSAGLLKMYAEAIESGEPLVLNEYSYPNELQQGERYYDIRAVRIGDSLSYTWRDVTDRYLSAQRIAVSEERYRLLAENAYEVVIRERGLHMTWVSPSLEVVLGWRPEEWLGHESTEFVHPDDVAEFRQLSASGVAGPALARRRVRAKNGTYHWVDSHSGDFINADGDVDGQIVTFHIVDAEVAAQETLEHRATYDDLTGALKRDPALAHLHEIGHHPRTPGVETGVLFIDVDDFKSVNDTWGHAAGDAVLRAITERVQQTVRVEDTVARMGGDEFMVTLGGIHDLPEAATIAEKIRMACSEPVTTPDGVVTTTLSIGVTLADPIESGDDLIARADKAMYAAKRAGRNRVVALPSRSGRSDEGA